MLLSWCDSFIKSAQQTVFWRNYIFVVFINWIVLQILMNSTSMLQCKMTKSLQICSNCSFSDLILHSLFSCNTTKSYDIVRHIRNIRNRVNTKIPLNLKVAVKKFRIIDIYLGCYKAPFFQFNLCFYIIF